MAGSDIASHREELPANTDGDRQTSYEGDSNFKLYLKDIRQVPLLTPQEEKELAIRIQKGDMEAREKMINANLRLVVKIAYNYEDLGLPLLDLINEGNIGLMKAVERFDPAKGNKLSTYAAWWIKQAIKRSLANQSKTIRLPIHLVEKISKLRRTEDKLQELFGRDPTDAELAEEMGITPQRIARLRAAAVRPASLDSPILEDENATLVDFVSDKKAADPYTHLQKKTVHSMLKDILGQLPERDAAILNYRYGLSGGAEHTLEEVGEVFGITRERVRQIQNAALAKLRRMIEKLEAVQK